MSGIPSGASSDFCGLLSSAYLLTQTALLGGPYCTCLYSVRFFRTWELSPSRTRTLRCTTARSASRSGRHRRKRRGGCTTCTPTHGSSTRDLWVPYFFFRENYWVVCCRDTCRENYRDNRRGFYRDNLRGSRPDIICRRGGYRDTFRGNYRGIVLLGESIASFFGEIIGTFS